MKINTGKIKQLLIIDPDIFYDFRGENMEGFNKEKFEKILDLYDIPKLNFVVDSFSFSKKKCIKRIPW